MAGERMKHEGEDLLGKAREGLGKVTGDEGLEAEGKGEQAAASVRKAADDVGDAVRHAVDAIGDDGR